MNLLFISLGCDKNLVDTEKMLGILGGEGYSFVDDESDADVIAVSYTHLDVYKRQHQRSLFSEQQTHSQAEIQAGFWD